MLSKSTRYTIQALSVLGGLPPGRYLGAKTIGGKLGIPANYLGKMLQNLARKGLVVSQKGFGGGFRLARPPEEISLLEIIEAVKEDELLSGCFWGNPACTTENPCPMHAQWQPITKLVRRTFRTTTVADITAKAEQ